MSSLEFVIHRFLPGHDQDPGDRETFADLEIRVGDRPITEVEDTLAGSVGSSIFVPALPLARWLIVNWWRLRWEAAPAVERSRARAWKRAHNLAAIGGDYAWPALELVSDGEYVRASMEAEEAPDMAAIRYLRSVRVNIPAIHFEQAVDRFTDEVLARLAIRLKDEMELTELKEELALERSNPDLARECKLQALAGIHPGEAGADWLREVGLLQGQTGKTAIHEVLSALNGSEFGPKDAEAALQQLRRSRERISLDWLREAKASCGEVSTGGEKAWDRGYRLARKLRAAFGIPSGPVSNRKLEELLHLKLPIEAAETQGFRLQGGVRGDSGADAAIALSSFGIERQRFACARLIACAVESAPQEPLLPVLDAGTALQKTERAFAQEFLCPWEDLNAFFADTGYGEVAFEKAARYFNVSERVIDFSLVNHGKVSSYQTALY